MIRLLFTLVMIVFLGYVFWLEGWNPFVREELSGISLFMVIIIGFVLGCALHEMFGKGRPEDD